MLINTTPHDIVLRDDNGGETTIPKSNLTVRVASSQGKRNDLAGVPCACFDADSVGIVEGLPPPMDGVFFLVSGLVGAAMSGSGRDDLLVPGTGPSDGAVRDAKGWIIAVTRLKRV